MSSGFLTKPMLTLLTAGVVVGAAGFLLFPAFPANPETLRLISAFELALAFMVGGALGRFVFPATPLNESPDRLKTVFVGNLAFKASPGEVRDLFSRYGQVHSVRIMTDRATRRPRGFGFVEMEQSAANTAIKALDGKPFHGRQLRVNEGRRKPERAQKAG